MTTTFRCAAVLGVFAAAVVVEDASAQAFYQSADGTVVYDKPAFADVSDPSSWDHLSASVAITRQSTRGIYNPLQESQHTSGTSPLGTLWFVGGTVQDVIDGTVELADFQDWVGAVGGSPQSTVGVDAVLYLEAEDSYLDFRLDSFGGGNSGGAVSYTRAAIPAPATAVPLLGGMLVVARRRRA